MKILIGFLLALFICSHAIALDLDSNEVLSKGKIIGQTTLTTGSRKQHLADAFFVIYKKALFKCDTLFDNLTCRKLDSRPALDARNEPIPD